MRKILSLLGSLSLVSMAGSTVVSCGGNKVESLKLIDKKTDKDVVAALPSILAASVKDDKLTKDFEDTKANKPAPGYNGTMVAALSAGGNMDESAFSMFNQTKDLKSSETISYFITFKGKTGDSKGLLYVIKMIYKTASDIQTKTLYDYNLTL